MAIVALPYVKDNMCEGIIMTLYLHSYHECQVKCSRQEVVSHPWNVLLDFPTLTVCEVCNSLKALRTWRDVWLIWTNNQLFSSLIYFGNMDLKVGKLCSGPFTFNSYETLYKLMMEFYYIDK